MTIRVGRIAIASILLVGVGASGSVVRAEKPTPTLEEALQQRITDNMVMPVMMGGQEMQGGIARVAFTVGSDGRTHNVKIEKRSGSGMVDSAAVRLISSFKALPPSLDGKPIYAVLQYRTSGEENDAAPKLALASQVALARADAVSSSRIASALPSATALAGKTALTAIAYGTEPKIPR